jgi:CubicO group peptidase (beta-lactamase class C family)
MAAEPAQANHANSADSNTTRARIARVEHGLEPLSLGATEHAMHLDVASLMRLNNDPGLSVAVIDHYQVVWAKAYGSINPAGKRPVTTRTLFQAGSISKPVTTAGMLALVNQGLLSLDEDVNAKLQSWKVPENELTKTQKVTLRRLASHTAGLTVEGFPGYDVDAALPNLVQILDGQPPANSPAIRVDFVPGSKSRYSGGGVAIEQQLMIDVTGESFPDLMKRLVLDKIGMGDSTYLEPLPEAWAVRTATGTYADGRPVHGRWHVYPEMAAAGLWTTPTDLARFAIEVAQAKNGSSHKVLPPTLAREMLTAQPGTDGDGALGFFVSSEKPGDFQHSGVDEGFQAFLLMNADTGQGIVVMANSANGIPVGMEYIHSVAREYAWRNMPGDRSEARQLVLIAKLRGVDRALSAYEAFKLSADVEKHPDEHVLDMLGYRLLQGGQTQSAIRALEKNATEYPHSADVYASLGVAYAAAGKSEPAVAAFKKSLGIDPDNQDAKDGLKKLSTK